MAKQGKGRNKPARQPNGAASTEHFSPAFVADGMQVLGKPNADDWRLYFHHICRKTRMTWRELSSAGKASGVESIPKESITSAIPAQHQNQNKFVAMRLGQGARLIGLRSGREFHAIWLDTAPFSVYKH